MENLTKKQKIIIGIAIAVIVSVIGYYIITNIQNLNNKEYTDDLEYEEEEIEEAEQEENTLKIEQEEIIVHIAGAVKSPGIAKLREGARIIDAIEASGGLTEDANLTNVNLAYVISDGQKIYIPHIDEETDVENKKVGVIENEEEKLTSKININTATVTELIEIPGIGNSTAQKIIEYRKENGKFINIEDIKNVSGIGEAKFNNIKDYITVK